MMDLEKSNPSWRIKNSILVVFGVIGCCLLFAGFEYRSIITGSAETNQYSMTEATLTLKYVPVSRSFKRTTLTETYDVAKATGIITKLTNKYRKNINYSLEYQYSPMQLEDGKVSGLNNSYRKQSHETNAFNYFLFPGDEEKFKKTCGYWLDSVEQWKIKARSKNYRTRFYAHQMRSGTGDRLAGAFTALNHAMKKGEIVDLAWPKLGQIFEPSSFIDNDPPLLNILDKPKYVLKSSCRLKSNFECAEELHRADHCPIYNRACISQSKCTQMRERYGSSLNMAHVLGCPMRIMFQPAKSFLNYPITLFIDNRTVTGPIIELLNDIKRKYETVAMHLRLGDAFMKSLSKSDLSRNSKERRENYWRKTSTNCVTTVDAHVANNSSGKPIKWIVSSDDMLMRRYYKEHFPDKVISLEINPIHVDKIFSETADGKRKTENMLNLFAEWFLLGSSDHMITNSPHNFGVSAFSRSAWIYQLKTEYYEIRSGSCLKRKYAYMGAFKEIPLACRNANGSIPDPQPDLPWSKNVL